MLVPMSDSSCIAACQLHHIPGAVPCREQDAIESGLIKKVMLRKSDNGTVPVDGDLVRWCLLPEKPGYSVRSSHVICPMHCMFMCSHERAHTADAAASAWALFEIKCHAPQVYVHYNVKTAEGQLLQSTWQAEGGAGLPLPFIIGAGRRAPRAWEIAFLSALTQPVACRMSPAVLPIVCHHTT